MAWIIKAIKPKSEYEIVSETELHKRDKVLQFLEAGYAVSVEEIEEEDE